MKLIITGTGRCGTVYMARLLTSLGLPCGHEAIFNLKTQDLQKVLEERDYKLSHCSCVDHFTLEKIPKWVDVNEIECDSSYMAAPFLDDPLIREVPVIHVTRNPLDVISSFILDGDFFIYKSEHAWSLRAAYLEKVVVPYENFMSLHAPSMQKAQSPLERACRFYIDWTKMIDESSLTRKFIRVKIEDQQPVSQQVLNFLDIKEVPKNVFSDNKSNTWKKRLRNYRVLDIPTTIRWEFLENAERLGYKLEG